MDAVRTQDAAKAAELVINDTWPIIFKFIPIPAKLSEIREPRRCFQRNLSLIMAEGARKINDIIR